MLWETTRFKRKRFAGRWGFVFLCAFPLAAMGNIKRPIERVESFVRLGSRVTGTPGNRVAARMVMDAFQEAGIQDLFVQSFFQSVAVDEGASLRLEGHPEITTIFPLLPNHVRSCHLSPEGVTGRLLAVGDGSYDKFQGQTVQGGIVLLDFNCQQRWLNAATLGARAVIFIEPESTIRTEAEQKFLRVPLHMPRFWIKREEGLLLAERASRERMQAEIRCKMPWRNAKTCNVCGLIQGTDPALKKQCVVIQAHYDSTSIVPSLAPGAEGAASLALLLELADRFASDPPKHSVLLLATGAHYQALAGTREFCRAVGREGQERRARLDEIEQRVGEYTLAARGEGEEALEAVERVRLLEGEWKLLRALDPYELPLFLSLDITSRSPILSMSYVGWYYQQSHLLRFFSPIGKRFLSHARDLFPDDVRRGLITDGINPTQERNWENAFPGKICYASEMAVRFGRPGVCLTSPGDSRMTINTPFDRPEAMDCHALNSNVDRAVALLIRFLNDKDTSGEMLKRLQKLKNDQIPAKGRVLEFQRRKSFLPNTPVPDSLVLVQSRFKSYMGVDGDIWTMTGCDASFEVYGHPGYGELSAYKVDEGDGAILYSPEMNVEQSTKYPRSLWGRGDQDRPIIVFPCESIGLTELVDQRYLTTLEEIQIYDAKTDAEPISYGYVRPDFQAMGAGELPSYVEPCAVVFGEPGSRLKISMSMGVLGLRFVLLNATREEPEGVGFELDRQGRILPRAAYQAAQDMWILDEARLERLREHGISNERLESLHDITRETLDRAQLALDQERYQHFFSLARSALGYESRAYPDVKTTANDVVKGVLFYLAILLPFSYFSERLFFSFPDIKRRIFGTAGSFVAVFVVLRYVHPAFELVNTSMVILLAFIILALAVVVISVITRRFNELLTTLKEEMGGVHTADVGRLSAAGSAVALGVANMRRRRARTFLTCLTLILLTFTVLSFTAVKSYLRSNRIDLNQKPCYKGFVLRDRVWDSLQMPILGLVRDRFGSEHEVAGRCWYVSGNIQKYALIDLVNPNPDKGRSSYTVNGLVGLSSQESKITGIDQCLAAGRWFEEDDATACILPETVAEDLGLYPDFQPEQTILLYGTPLEVVGVLREESLMEWEDLDGEPLTPVDYMMLKPEVLEEMNRQRERTTKYGKFSESALLQEYTHMAPERVAFLPFPFVMNLGGTLRSVAVHLGTDEAVQDALDEMMRRYAVNVYVGEGDKTTLRSSVGLTTMQGLQRTAMPMLIAALIVLNTMLGSVYERVREIGVYSSVGLAPVHISTLFLAESAVFANMGAVGGYLLGQTLCKVMFTHWPEALAGFSLNYSSLSAVGSTMIVMIVVLLSTYYPAKKASQMSVPGVARKWSVPEPVGDLLSVELPFTLRAGDAKPMSAFLAEFFDAHVDYAGGDFTSTEPELTEGEDGESFSLRFRVWLAPFDLGVSQWVCLVLCPSGEEDLWSIAAKMEREGGDIRSWVRTNWYFLNDLRKQLLIWRVVGSRQKKEYEEAANRRMKAATTSSMEQS